MSLILSAALIAAQAFAPQAVAPQAASPQPVGLSMQQQTAMRCSVAIAMAAERQKAGKGDPARPDLSQRGREFFVRSLARLMEETGMTRQALMQAATQEAADLQDGGNLEQVMPACLLMLNASGL